MKFAEIADRIAGNLDPSATFEDIWDECDSETYGDLDTTQMDILSSMVEKRLAKK